MELTQDQSFTASTSSQQTETENNNFKSFNLISTYGSYGSEENDKLNYPMDIIYGNNLLFIADTRNFRILILDSSLNYENKIDLSLPPLALATNKKYLYIACSNENNEYFIYKYNLSTLQFMNEIKSDSSNYEFNIITGMACDLENNLFIANFGSQEITVLNESDELIRKFKINLQPQRIIINNKNQIVMVGDLNYCNELQIYDQSGTFIENIKFENLNLTGLVCDCKDNYFICDGDNNKVLVLNCNFKLLCEFIEDIYNPISISVNKESNEIYMAEMRGHCVKLFKY